MRIGIRLYGKRSKNLVDKLLKSGTVELSYIVDIDARKWNTTDNETGLAYISPYKAYSLYKNGKIEGILISPYSGARIVYDCIGEMLDMGFERSDLYCPSTPETEECECIEEAFLREHCSSEYKTIHRLQIHLTDHCNLNCELCSHFSSLVHSPQFADIEETENDLRQLRLLVKHIDRIDLLGGEPFLHPQWKFFVEKVVEIYPYTEITIITNGLKLKSLDEDDWSFIRSNNVVLRLSVYQPLWKEADELQLMMQQKGICYFIEPRVISHFNKVLLIKPDGDYSWKRMSCMAFHHNEECNQLWHGKMTPCAHMMYVSFFNNEFGTRLPENVPIEDIYSVDSFDALMDGLKKPMELCGYCNLYLFAGSHLHKRAWQQHSENTKAEDWMLDWSADA